MNREELVNKFKDVEFKEGTLIIILINVPT